MTINPTAGIVVLKKLKDEFKTDSGFILNSRVEDQPIAIIKEINYTPEQAQDFKVGDMVLYDKFGGIQTIMINNEELIVGKINIIQAILEEETMGNDGENSISKTVNPDTEANNN